MAAVLCEGTKFVVDQGFTGGALAGSGALLVSLAKLVAELHGSKEMCQDLIIHISDLMPQLDAMLKNDNIKTSKDVLTAYEALLRDVEIFLQNHVDTNPFYRLLNHRKMKKRVEQYYVKREVINRQLSLKFQEESANRHGESRELLLRVIKLEEQTQAVVSNDIKQLAVQMERNGQKVIDTLDDMNVVAADLKHELKTQRVMYTKSELKELQGLYKDVMKLVPVPHLEPWYLGRPDFRFDERSPFITGQFRSIHHGTLSSGAEVTIKTVMAGKGDKKNRDNFVKEVETWYALRNPHVLPLYGANHIASPMVFVCGRAELGNFNEYLSTHPHRFWQVFLDAARGLAYLHQQQRPLVHGNLKCNNLLVTKHGVGVLSDFMFAFVRTNSQLSLKEQTPDHFWKAPECFIEKSNPRVESDVYSLGMCIFEAMSGAPPYADIEENDAITMIVNGELPNRPDGRITDEAWNLITKMCRRSFQDRDRLDFVISKLEVLAAQEQIMRSQLPCSCMTTCCCECGGERRFIDVAAPAV